MIVVEHLTALLRSSRADSKSERAVEVMLMRYGSERRVPCSEIARRFGVSKERIRQIEMKALRRLRRTRPETLIAIGGEHTLLGHALFGDCLPGNPECR